MGIIRNQQVGGSTRSGGYMVSIWCPELGEFRVKEPHVGLSEVTLEASWVVAFDTGDFWTFITELANKLENA